MYESRNISTRVQNSEPSSTVMIADKARQLRERGQKVFDFSAGRAFEPTPAYVVEAATEAMRSGDTHQTMARGTTAYRKACAAKLQRENNITADPETELVATMGAKQGLTISLLALINPGDEVIVEDPCFVSYRQTIHYLGGKAVSVPLRPENNFRWDKAELESYISPRTKAIILCSPHNPTGVVHTSGDLQELAGLAIKYNLYVITDEVYERMTWDGRQHVNLATLPGMRSRTVTLMSLTKSFSMGGWRIGFVYANQTIITELEKLQQHLITSVNSFVQAGGAVAFGREPLQEVRDYWTEWEKKVRYFTSALNDIDGLKCNMPEGSFYAWTDISSFNISSKNFATRLLDNENVAVIHGSSFGKTGSDYIRITCVKSWEEIKEGLSRIRAFVQGL